MLALPLDLLADGWPSRTPSTGFAVLDGVAMPAAGRRPHCRRGSTTQLGSMSVEVVLQVGQEQGAHAQRVDEHVLGALDVEEP